MDERVKKILFAAEVPMLNLAQVAVVLLTAFFGAQLTWGIIAPEEAKAPSAFGATVSSVSSSSPGGTKVSLKALNLFGLYVEEDQGVQDEAIDVPITSLKLKLQGVFAAKDPKKGTAIISNQSGESISVAVGGNVFEQALLAAVYNDRIILDRRGVFETLYFELPDPSVAGQRAPTGGTSNTGISRPDPPKPQIEESPLLSGSTNEIVTELRELAYSNPQSLVDRMGLEASDDGYQVTRRARQLLFLGLRPGDTIVSVNDMSVGNVQQDAALIDQVLSGGEVKIEIQRGNRRFSIYQAIPQ